MKLTLAIITPVPRMSGNSAGQRNRSNLVSKGIVREQIVLTAALWDVKADFAVPLAKGRLRCLLDCNAYCSPRQTGHIVLNGISTADNLLHEVRGWAIR